MKKRALTHQKEGKRTVILEAAEFLEGRTPEKKKSGVTREL